MMRSVPKRPECWFRLSDAVRLTLDHEQSSTTDDIWPDFRGKVALAWRERPYMLFGVHVIRQSPASWSTLTHEMAHFIDIDDKRAMDFGYGLKTGKKFVPTPGNRYSPGFWETTTSKCIRRELRVTAIQAAIQEHWGFTMDYAYYAHLLKHVAGDWFFEQEVGLDFEDMKPDNVDEENPHYSIGVHVQAGIIRAMREQIRIEDVWTEWQRKTMLVERRIERYLKGPAHVVARRAA